MLSKPDPCTLSDRHPKNHSFGWSRHRWPRDQKMIWTLFRRVGHVTVAQRVAVLPTQSRKWAAILLWRARRDLKRDAKTLQSCVPLQAALPACNLNKPQ